jgi:hypothetical protein
MNLRILYPQQICHLHYRVTASPAGAPLAASVKVIPKVTAYVTIEWKGGRRPRRLAFVQSIKESERHGLEFP